MNAFFKNAFLTLIATVAIASANTVSAQAPDNPAGDKKEQIEAQRVAFITMKLNLTKEEAQKFWPVYNEYRDALEALRKERHDELKSYRDKFDSLTEKELTEFVDKQIIYRQRELDLKKKYHAEFKGVLPIKKVALLYLAEDEFRTKVMKEFKERHEGQ